MSLLFIVNLNSRIIHANKMLGNFYYVTSEDLSPLIRGSSVRSFTDAKEVFLRRTEQYVVRPTQQFEICSQWLIDARAEELKAILSDPMSILQWWSSVFVGGEVLSGNNSKELKAKFFTKGFLPHTFQFVAWIEEKSDNLVVVKTDGDFGGVGTIQLYEEEARSVVDVKWAVTVNHPYMWPFLRILKPVFVWNHLWAMKQGKKGLEAFLDPVSAQNFVEPKPTFPHNLPYFKKPRNWRV